MNRRKAGTWPHATRLAEGKHERISRSQAAPATIADEAPSAWWRNWRREACQGQPSSCSAYAAILAIALTLNQLLNLQLFAGIVFIENRYLYLAVGVAAAARVPGLRHRSEIEHRQCALVRLAACARERRDARLVRVAGSEDFSNRAGNTVRQPRAIVASAIALPADPRRIAARQRNHDDRHRRAWWRSIRWSRTNSRHRSRDTPSR